MVGLSVASSRCDSVVLLGGVGRIRGMGWLFWLIVIGFSVFRCSFGCSCCSVVVRFGTVLDRL